MARGTLSTDYLTRQFSVPLEHYIHSRGVARRRGYWPSDGSSGYNVTSVKPPQNCPFREARRTEQKEQSVKLL